jgi:hypothetical protein
VLVTPQRGHRARRVSRSAVSSSAAPHHTHARSSAPLWTSDNAVLDTLTARS